jgi:hypothetical protein
MDIEKAKERFKKLGESIRKAENVQNERKDKVRTRKAILLGACMMAQEERCQKFIESEAFDRFLTKNRDRELFGLPLIPEKKEKKLKTPEPEIPKKIADNEIE